MNIVLDIIAVIVFLFAIYRGYKKGFVKTVLNLCGGIVCLILAISFSPTFGQFINQNYMEPAVERIVTDRMSQIAVDEATNQPDVDKIVEDKPGEFSDILEKFNIDFDAFKQSFENFKNESTENASQAAVDYIAKPLSQTVSYVIAFILILVASLLAVSVLTFLLDKLVKLPILRTANKFLGVLSGILFGLLWVYIVAMIVEIALPYMKSSEYPLLAQTSPENSMVFKYFFAYNPIYEMIKAIF
ncbi:MAG: CvpA family protein [Ruminococcaceae bacterium]|nr:CvpA family protein [Oscillospiraceae bacterium]